MPILLIPRSPSGQDVSPSGVASTAAVGAPTVTLGPALDVSPPGVAATTSIGAFALEPDATAGIFRAAIASAEAEARRRRAGLAGSAPSPAAFPWIPS